MPYEPKPMTGALFRCRSKAPNAPVMQGDVVLPDGTTLRVSAWWATDKGTEAKRKDQHGNPWLNLKLQTEEEAQGGRQTTRTAPAEAADDDSNIPF